MENIKKLNNKMKLLYVTPHLSTGGMPQFLLKRLKELQKYKDEIEIFVVEFSMFSHTYIVQRDEIINLLDDEHFINLSILGEETQDEKKERLIDIIKEKNIDIVHFEEISEAFESFNKVSKTLLNAIYTNDRTWKIVETCHNNWFNPINRKLHPDAYSLVTPHHFEKTFKNEPSYKEVHVYPIEDLVTEIKEKHEIYNNEFRVPLIEKIAKREKLGLDPFKTHVLNVGLWTEGKNQGEGVEIARKVWEKNKNIHFHFIGNQAPNFENYWEPIMKNLPPNVTVWYERNDVSDFMIASDVFMFNSINECNPLVLREAISYGMKIIARNLPQYVGMFDGYITEIDATNKDVIQSSTDKLLNLIDSNLTYTLLDNFDLGKSLRDFYFKVLDLEFMKNVTIKNDYTFSNHYVLNPYLEINGTTENKLNVKFFDKNQLVYENNVSINTWMKMNKQYYSDWRVEVRENDELIYQNTNNYEGKRVFISFGSKSLGDTLAWFPYVEEFRKRHKCKVIVSTFMNYLFKDQYPEIDFVEPGSVVYDIAAQYNLGWFYKEDGVFDSNRNPNDFKTIPLQQTASDILGFDYKEIRPKLNLPKVEKKKKVGIGFHSTAQSKYWNNKKGWQEVVDYLNNLGYECMIYSKEGDGYMNNFYPKGVTTFKGGSLQEVINDLVSCEFFVGLGSGLSWLAWACELPVVLISGFSEKWSETTLDTYRVINENVCHGCFNWNRLDAGDWNWCPIHKGTNKMFECTKEIGSEMVIEQIEKIINKTKSNVPSDFDWGWMNKSEMVNADFHKMAITEEIFDNKIYEKYFEVNEGDVVMDIGSSVGPFTKSILHKKPKHVFCLEPSEVEFKTLVKNTVGYPVTQINKGIGSSNSIVVSDQLFGGEKEMETITFKKLVELYSIEKIDFLKLDCEGGEYDVFNNENLDYIKNNVKKISGEWHLGNQKLNDNFRNFRDNILPNFKNYEVSSLDGVDIKWDLWNEHFLEYYNEVIIYIDNI